MIDRSQIIAWVTFFFAAASLCVLPLGDSFNPANKSAGWGTFFAYLLAPCLFFVFLWGDVSGALGRWFGKISYSIYLLHWPVVTVIMHFFDWRSHVWLAFGLYVTISMLVSWLTLPFIEQPSITLGRRVVKRMSGRAGYQFGPRLLDQSRS